MFILLLYPVGTHVVVANHMLHHLRGDLIGGVSHYLELPLLEVVCTLHHVLLGVWTRRDVLDGDL